MKIETQIALLKVIENKDIESLKRRLELLIDSIVQIQLKFYKKEISDWKDQKLEYLLVKFTLHQKSFLKTIEPTLINSQNPNSALIDISSTFVIVRSIIENFLTIFYLYILPENEDEFEFFHQLYSGASMMRRQDLKKNYNDNDEQPSQRKLEEEKLILDLVDKLKVSPFYKSLNKHKRKNIESMSSTNMKAMIYNWNELIIKSDLRNELFKNTWRLASSYAHSEELALVQLKDYYSSEKGKFAQINFLSSMINLNCMLNSKMILFVKKKYEWAEPVFNESPDNIIHEIEFWNKIATEIK